jgi:DNA-binding NarL/FixJ family response regulator
MDKAAADDEYTIRVALVTPPGALRAGVRAMLSGETSIQITAEAASIDALSGLPAGIDVIVATSGAVRRARKQDDFQTAMLVLANSDELDANMLPLQAQAWGILPLEADASSLRAAIHALHEGLVVGPARLLKRVLDGSHRSSGSLETEGDEALTPREVEVLQQLAVGLTNKQIALALGISEHTVKYHISSIYGKLGVMNRAEAVHTGVRRGWIEV